MGTSTILNPIMTTLTNNLTSQSLLELESESRSKSIKHKDSVNRTGDSIMDYNDNNNSNDIDKVPTPTTPTTPTTTTTDDDCEITSLCSCSCHNSAETVTISKHEYLRMHNALFQQLIQAQMLAAGVLRLRRTTRTTFE